MTDLRRRGYGTEKNDDTEDEAIYFFHISKLRWTDNSYPENSIFLQESRVTKMWRSRLYTLFAVQYRIKGCIDYFPYGGTRAPCIPVVHLVFIFRIFKFHFLVHVDNRHHLSNLVGYIDAGPMNCDFGPTGRPIAISATIEFVARYGSTGQRFHQLHRPWNWSVSL